MNTNLLGAIKMIYYFKSNTEKLLTEEKVLLLSKGSQKSLDLNPSQMSDLELNQLISTLAYLKSEENGFVAGNEVNDWLEAEKIVKSYIC
jgi:hypothetical protein